MELRRGKGSSRYLGHAQLTKRQLSCSPSSGMEHTVRAARNHPTTARRSTCSRWRQRLWQGGRTRRRSCGLTLPHTGPQRRTTVLARSEAFILELGAWLDWLTQARGRQVGLTRDLDTATGRQVLPPGARSMPALQRGQSALLQVLRVQGSTSRHGGKNLSRIASCGRHAADNLPEDLLFREQTVRTSQSPMSFPDPARSFRQHVGLVLRHDMPADGILEGTLFSSWLGTGGNDCRGQAHLRGLRAGASGFAVGPDFARWRRLRGCRDMEVSMHTSGADFWPPKTMSRRSRSLDTQARQTRTRRAKEWQRMCNDVSNRFAMWVADADKPPMGVSHTPAGFEFLSKQVARRAAEVRVGLRGGATPRTPCRRPSVRARSAKAKEPSAAMRGPVQPTGTEQSG